MTSVEQVTTKFVCSIEKILFYVLSVLSFFLILDRPLQWRKRVFNSAISDVFHWPLNYVSIVAFIEWPQGDQLTAAPKHADHLQMSWYQPIRSINAYGA